MGLLRSISMQKKKKERKKQVKKAIEKQFFFSNKNSDFIANIC